MKNHGAQTRADALRAASQEGSYASGAIYQISIYFRRKTHVNQIWLSGLRLWSPIPESPRKGIAA